MKDDFESERHPCFGLVQFSRITGGHGQLFGSHLDEHYETVRLRINRAVREHGLSHDFYMGREQVVEVELSPQQFAQLLTTINVGSGVPCTIRYVTSDGEGRVEDMPSYETEQLRILRKVSDNLADMTKDIQRKRARLEDILGKKAITKMDRKEILELNNDIFMWFESNASFAFKSFEESAEKVVTAAKAQVDDFVLSILTRLGMEKLSNKFTLKEKLLKLHGKE